MKRILYILTLLTLSLSLLRAAEYNRTVCVGEGVTLTADVVSDFYQWYCDGVAIPGENSQTLVLSGLTADHTYSVSSRESYPTIKSNMFDNGGFEDESKMTAMKSDYNYKGWEKTDIYGSGGLSGQNNLWVVSKNANTTWHDYLPVTACQGTHFALYDAGASGRAWYADTENNPNLKIEAGKKYYFSYSAVNINPHIYRNTATRAYSANPDNWSSVYCYIWDSYTTEEIAGGWPGIEMTYNAAGKYWYYDIPSGKTWNSNWMIIYNCGSALCKTGDKTYMDYCHASDLQKELDSHPARLVFNVKDRTTDTEYPLDVLDLACTSSDPSSHTWQHRQATFVSPVTSNNVEVNVYNTTSIAGDGNDFGLDSLMFQLEDWSSTRPVDSTVFHVKVPNLHVSILPMETVCVLNPNFVLSFAGKLDAATYDVTFSASEFASQNAIGVTMPSDGKFVFTIPLGWNNESAQATFRFHDATNTCSYETTVDLSFRKKPEMTFTVPATVSVNDEYLTITYKGQYFLTASISFASGWTENYTESQILHDGNTHTLNVPIAGHAAGTYTPVIHLSSDYCDYTLPMPSFEIIGAVSVTTAPVGTGADHIICSDVSAFSVPFVTTGAPVAYSMQFSSPLFTPVSSATLPASGEFIINLPSDVPAGAYSAYIKVWDATSTSFGYDTVHFTLADRPDYVLADPVGVICSSDGHFTLSKVGGTIAPTKYSLSFSSPLFTAVDKADWPASDIIDVAIPSTLPEGIHTYFVTITLYDASLACPMAEQHLPFTVASTPEVTLSPVTDHTYVCSTDASISVHYVTSGSPTHYSAKILREDMTTERTFPLAAILSAEGDWDFDVSGITPGNYTLSATVMSDDLGSCPTTGSIAFSVAKQPLMTFIPTSAFIARTAGGLDVNYITTVGKANSFSIAVSGPTAVSEQTGIVDATGSGTYHLTLPSPLAPGVYTATVTVSGDNTCTNTATFSWTVVDDQGIAFSATSYPMCIGTASVEMPYSVVGGAPAKYKLTVTPSGSGIADVTTYTALPAGKFTFNTSSAAAGTYTLSVTVCDATETVSSTATTQLFVEAEPTLSLTVPTTVSADSATIKIPYTSTGVVDYLLDMGTGWSIAGDMESSGTLSLPITGHAPGTYTGTLTYRSNHCEETTTVTFRIVQSIVLSIDEGLIGNDGIVCSDEATIEIPITTLTGASRYSMEFSSVFTDIADAAIPSGSFSVPVPANAPAGAYTVYLTVWDATATSFARDTLHFTLAARPDYVMVAPTAVVCSADGMLQFTKTTGTVAPTTYSLTFSDTHFAAKDHAAWPATNTIEVAIPSTLDAGTHSYTATLTLYDASNTCAMSTQTLPFTVASTPSLTLFPIAGETDICSTESVTSVSYTTTGAPTYYRAEVLRADNTVAKSYALTDLTMPSGDLMFDVFGLTAGNYTLRITVQSDAVGSCTATQDMAFSIAQQPVMTFIPSSAFIAKTAGGLDVVYSTSSGKANTFAIAVSGPTAVSEQTGTVDASGSGTYHLTLPSPLAPGVYTATVTVSGDNTCTNTATFSWTVVDDQGIAFSATSYPMCIGTASVEMPYSVVGGAPAKYKLTVTPSGSGIADVTTYTALPAGKFTFNTSSAAAGTYTLSVTVCDATETVSSTATTQLFVEAEPTLSLTVPTTVSADSTTIKIPYTSTGVVDYLLDMGTGWSIAGDMESSGTLSLPITGHAPGTYTGTLTYRSNHCEETTTVTFRIVQSIELSLDETLIGNDGIVCSDEATIEIPITTLTGASRYSMEFSSVFADIADAAIPSGSFSVPVPANAPAGAYMVYLTVWDATATSFARDTLHFTLAARPDYVMVAPTAVVCSADGMLQFTKTTGTVAPTTYSLTFSDTHFAAKDHAAWPATNTIEVAIPSTLDAGTQSYTATLTLYDASNTCAMSTQTLPFTVASTPTLQLTRISGETDICETANQIRVAYEVTGAPTSFLAEIYEAGTLVRSTTGAVISASDTLTMSVNGLSAGSYTLRMTVMSDALGSCVDEKEMDFSIAAMPTMTFTPQIDTISTLTGSLDVDYVVTSGTAVSFEMSFSGPTPILSQQGTVSSLGSGTFHISLPAPMAPGNYTATVSIAGQNTCETSATFSWYIAPDAPTFAIDAVTDLCSGDSILDVVLHTIEGTPVAYSYRVEGSSGVFAEASNQPWPSQGMISLRLKDIPADSYTLTMTAVSNFGGVSDEQSVSFLVIATPTATITLLEPVCRMSEEVIVEFTHSSAASYSLELLASNGQVVFTQPLTPIASSPLTFYPAPLEAGQYRLRLTVYDATAGCSSVVEETLVVKTPPVVEVNPDQIVCFDEGSTAFALSYTTSSGQVDSFEAEVRCDETGVVLQQPRTALTGMMSFDLGAHLDEGTYRLIVRFFDSACEVESETTMFVASDTIVYAKWDDLLFCNNGDDRFVSYQWYHDGEPVDGQTGQYLTGDLATGEYYVEATTTSGEKLYSCPRLFEAIPHSADLNPGTRSASLMPNPVRSGDPLHVRTEGIETYTVELYSLTGTRLMLSEAQGSDVLLTPSMALPANTYVLIVRDHLDGKAFPLSLIVE